MGVVMMLKRRCVRTGISLVRPEKKLVELEDFNMFDKHQITRIYSNDIILFDRQVKVV